MYKSNVLDHTVINIALMYKRQKKKCKKEPYGYQPNNPLTIYYKKYIEKADPNDFPDEKISKKKNPSSY